VLQYKELKRNKYINYELKITQ